jgi:tricarballylate dehydrogenase
VTGGATNERLARLTIRESETLGEWMRRNGVRWQKPLRGTLHLRAAISSCSAAARR